MYHQLNYCFAVADKVMVKQDREFQVVLIEHEAGWRTASTQDACKHGGKPSRYKNNMSYLDVSIYIARWSPY